nr:hypothetical chloroplast RF1 [Microspora sp. UTEX LB472]
MYTLSLVTSVKDYIEVVHKLLESDPQNYEIKTYNDLGALLSYLILIGKQFLSGFFRFDWLASLNQIRSFPNVVPDIASAAISEISVLDSYFHNAFSLLEKPIFYGDQNLLFYSLEKFSIGLLNSFFLFLPTSTASLISFRRFFVQGIEAGYFSGLGTLLGSLLWIASIIFGWRFLVIPWLSLDILRYALGLILLVKYMWDSYTERRMVLEDLSKWKIFSLTFLLAFTEQTSLFPFLGNISISSDMTILESFPSNHFVSFFIVHGCYLLGLGLGGLSLLYFTCWFWENPAFRLYTWTLSAIKINIRFDYKFINSTFLFLTMICAMSNLVYFGLDYTLTKPLGFVTNDRLIDQKTLLETSFLSTKASDRNTRMNMGRRGRRERWKKSVQRYRNFDSSLYGEGVYDLFTIEDLNYGFDRFWLRRKMRNHDVPFRLFPGPWVRSFKKQLSRPRLESFSGPRLEFFRILFEQVYHPIFHEKKLESLNKSTQLFDVESFSNAQNKVSQRSLSTMKFDRKDLVSLKSSSHGLIHEFSALRKFVRKVNIRIKTSKIALDLVNKAKLINLQKKESAFLQGSIYSKRWKELFSKMDHNLFSESNSNPLTKKQYSLKKQLLFKTEKQLIRSKEKNPVKNFSKLGISDWIIGDELKSNYKFDLVNSTKKMDFQKLLSKKDNKILNYRSFLTQSDSFLTFSEAKNAKNANQITKSNEQFDKNSEIKKQNQIVNVFALKNSNKDLDSSSFAVSNLKSFQNFYKPLTLLHPIKFYLHKEKAFQRKFKFYGANVFRNFGVSNNSPHFRIMMKKFFYYFKPTLRWERTMRVATLKKIRRKSSRKPLRINLTDWNQSKQNNNLPLLVSEGNKIDSANSIRNSNGNLPSIQTELIPLTISNQNLFNLSFKNGLQKPTHMYSLIGKRATRYRSQIYKDVLQHWYYSSFNRLLLKFDIDAFIRRQPVSHFLTKNEEHLLHFRRALLMDHYETLRWYTYMQHYRSMKVNIGGTKSFATRFYNQQFQGTFKKIRHLFSVTPTIGMTFSNVDPNQKNSDQLDNRQNLLKWDQPLYNEYPNNQNFSVLNDSLLHEELFVDNELQKINLKPIINGMALVSEVNQNLNRITNSISSANSNNSLSSAFAVSENIELASLNPSSLFERTDIKKGSEILTNSLELNPSNVQAEDLVNHSKRIIGEYLLKAGPIRQKLIAKYLHEKNYAELTRFLFKGQKTRGSVATTQLSTFLNQEKEYLYTDLEKQYLREKERNDLKQFIQKEKIKQKLWISLIKKSQTTVYDRKALKNYLKNKIDKQEKRKKIRQKQLQDRLNRVKNWLIYKPILKNKSILPEIVSLETFKNHNQPSRFSENLSTGINKALKESLQIQEGFLKSKRPLVSEANSFSISLETKKIFLKKNFKKNELLEKKLQNSLLNISNLVHTNLIKQTSHQFFSSAQKKLNFGLVKRPKPLIWKIQSIFKFESNRNRITKRIGDSSTNKNQLSFITLFKNWFKKKNEINIQAWKRKQHVLSKRKQTRKVLKQLKRQTNRMNSTLLTPVSEAKQKVFGSFEFSVPKKKSFFSKNGFSRQPSLKIEDKTSKKFLLVPLPKTMKIQSLKRDAESNRQKQDSKEPWNYLNFSNDFQTRRARRRGARASRNRGAIKKPTLNDKLKRQFQILKRYGKKIEITPNEKEKEQRNEISDLILKKNPFQKRMTKQRRTRQRENRVWHRYKKSKYSQNRRKLKKRKRFSIGKIRGLNKELKRIESYSKIRKWWWESFLPDFRAHTDTWLQFSKNQQIQEKLNTLSPKEILQRNAKGYENFIEKVSGEQSLEVGNYDYKPLSLPCTSPLLNDFFSKTKRCNNSLGFNLKSGNDLLSSPLKYSEKNLSNQTQESKGIKDSFIIDILSQNLLTSVGEAKRADFLPADQRAGMSIYPNKFIVSINPMPFYAGWDETSRKFIVTNRLLSRREAGYQIFNLANVTNTKDKKDEIALAKLTNLYSMKEKPVELEKQIGDSFSPNEFTNYPLKGMNVATTLYWQVPFTTYDPDQFFALGRDGFAPIGWKRFKFQYTKQTLKPILVKTKILTHQNISAPIFEKMRIKILNKVNFSTNRKSIGDLYSDSITNQKLENRIYFSQKRNKRIKRHPRSPASFPSGPLISQVLPVHYIYVFYKRDRLPRDRYISRRLRRSKDGPSFAMQNSFVKLADWTLRKRVKPRRKYHRKRKNSQTSNTLRNSPKTILRRKFRSYLTDPLLEERQRPLSKPKLGTGQQLEGRLKERYKQRKKNQNIKSKNENVRLRQLRRRVQRQVFRPVWRYRPHPGGWLWPGDYFRLELIKAPKLVSTFNQAKNADLKRGVRDTSLPSSFSKEEQKKEIRRKAQKKKKRNIQNWQVQSKNYLVEKHNMKVLKKRLQKSQNSHKLN